MNAFPTYWYDVDEAMPPDDDKTRPVRMLYPNGSHFYSNAFFNYSVNKWVFEHDENSHYSSLTVTHWCDIKDEWFKNEAYRNVHGGMRLL